MVLLCNQKILHLPLPRNIQMQQLLVSAGPDFKRTVPLARTESEPTHLPAMNVSRC